MLVLGGEMVRNKWPLGRIYDVFPGSDCLVRSVEVRTKTGVYKRPISKICFLEGCT